MLLPCKKWRDKSLSKEQVAPQDVPKALNPWHPQDGTDGTAIRRPEGQEKRTKWLQGPRIIDETSISVTLSLYQTSTYVKVISIISVLTQLIFKKCFTTYAFLLKKTPLQSQSFFRTGVEIAFAISLGLLRYNFLP